MDQNYFNVGIQPVGEIDQIYLKAVAGSLIGELGVRTRILPVLEHPSYAFDKRRIQYNAGFIIKKLEAMEFSGITKVIALIYADLFIPVFSFVLGEARMGGRCALVSLARLKQDSTRTVKVAMHEFGHLMNLGHCMEEGCVMNFSKNIERLDMVSTGFCRFCLENIRYRLLT